MIEVSLELELYMVLFGEEHGWDLRMYDVFMIGESNWVADVDWKEKAQYHFSKRYSNNAQLRTIHRCIKRQLNMALTSPALYIRTYAELVKNEPNPEEV